MKQEPTEQATAPMPAERGGKPRFAMLWPVVVVIIALMLPLLGSPARAELDFTRRGSDSRFDPGPMRLQTLILPSPDYLRKAQSIKVPPKTWMPGGGDAAFAARLAADLALSSLGAGPASVPGPRLFPKPRRGHGPRAPPAPLSAA